MRRGGSVKRAYYYLGEVDLMVNKKMEAEVVADVRALRSAGFPVTRDTIKELGAKSTKTFAAKATSEQERKKYDDFTASHNWITKFLERNRMSSTLLHGEAGSVDDAAIAEGMATIRSIVSEYDRECVFNVDETGLFHRMLPRRSYLAPGEDRKTTRGVKGMSAKERMTQYVCTNAAGTKAPLVAIGPTKNPRCFRLRQPPFKYLQQVNS